MTSTEDRIERILKRRKVCVWCFCSVTVAQGAPVSKLSTEDKDEVANDDFDEVGSESSGDEEAVGETKDEVAELQGMDQSVLHQPT